MRAGDWCSQLPHVRDLCRMRDFTKLRVWRAAHELAVGLYRISLTMRGRSHAALGSQLRRAVASIPANVVEGSTKESDTEFRRFLVIAAASASETEYHLMLMRDVEASQAHIADPEIRKVQSVRRQISALIQKLDIAMAPAGRTAESRTPSTDSLEQTG